METDFDQIHRQMRQRILEDHQLAVRKDDPLLVALTANLVMIEETQRAAQAQQELGLAACEERFKDLSAQQQASISASVDSAVAALKRWREQDTTWLQQALEHRLHAHEDAMQRLTTATIVATAVAALSAVAVLLLH